MQFAQIFLLNIKGLFYSFVSLLKGAEGHIL